jgi:hypothetical protein
MIDIQRQMVELGRIRTGDQVDIAGQAGKKRPRKLETFRLTSQNKELIAEAARLYGGTPGAWNDQWEVVITAETLPIMLPPGEAMSQWWELWDAGGCKRRCEGTGGRNVLADEPCSCPEDKTERAELAKNGKACKPTTRLNVILPELPGLGLWRLESHGHYAAVELAGAAEYLSMATSLGHRVPAHLRIVNRSRKVKVLKDGNESVQTRNWTVPTIDIDVRPMDLLGGGTPVAQIAAPAERLPSGPVNRRERVARPASPPSAALPDRADMARTNDPPLGEPPELPGDGFLPPEEAVPQPAAPPPEVTMEEVREAADTAGIDGRKLAGRLFPAWLTANPKRGLNAAERTQLLAAIKRGES